VWIGILRVAAERRQDPRRNPAEPNLLDRARIEALHRDGGEFVAPLTRSTCLRIGRIREGAHLRDDDLALPHSHPEGRAPPSTMPIDHALGDPGIRAIGASEGKG